MAERVVDQLEVVEVDEQHGGLLTVLGITGEFAFETLEQQVTGRKPGQRIVRRRAHQLCNQAAQVIDLGIRARGQVGIRGATIRSCRRPSEGRLCISSQSRHVR